MKRLERVHLKRSVCVHEGELKDYEVDIPPGDYEPGWPVGKQENGYRIASIDADSLHVEFTVKGSIDDASARAAAFKAGNSSARLLGHFRKPARGVAVVAHTDVQHYRNKGSTWVMRRMSDLVGLLKPAVVGGIVGGIAAVIVALCIELLKRKLFGHS